MPRLVIDATLPEKLLAQPGPVELVDPSGRVVGVFKPFRLEPQISAEELERIRKEPGARHLADILGEREKPS